jgi:hypothetical protein
MKITINQLRRIIKEEVARALNEDESQIPVPSVWVWQSTTPPNGVRLNGQERDGAMGWNLLVTSVQGDNVAYRSFSPMASVTINGKSYDNLFSAVQRGNVSAEAAGEALGGSGTAGESYNMPIDTLLKAAKKMAP